MREVLRFEIILTNKQKVKFVRNTFRLKEN